MTFLTLDVNVAVNKKYLVVKTLQDLEKMRSHIEKHELLAFDTESTGLNVRKDQVIGFSVSGEVGIGFYLPMRSALPEVGTKPTEFYDSGLELLKMLLDKDLVMHNGSYDIRITRNNLGVDLINNLVADTILMKHTVDEIPPFGLKEIAAKIWYKLGIASKEEATSEQKDLKESVLKNGGEWKKGAKDMYKADVEILGTYAAADTDLTLRLFNHYYDEIEKEGLLEFFFDVEVMPLYREVTIGMEDNGILLDIPKIIKYDCEIIKDMAILEDKIREELAPHVGNLETHLLEKYTKISNKGRFAQLLCSKFDLQLPKTAKGSYSLLSKNIDKLKANADNQEVINFLKGRTTMSLSFRDLLYGLQKEYYLQAHNTDHLLNIQSKDHLSIIYFDTLKEAPLSLTSGGKPQMNEAMLEKLAEKYESAALISEYNKLLKIKSSYIDRFLRENENGFFYPSFKQFGTISGRYGSDLQQLPRPEDDDSGLSPLVLKYRNVIREFFIVEDGYKFIDCDYESLEPHVFADDAGDEALIKIFENGHDMYSTVAIEVSGLQNDYSADKNADNYLKKHQAQLRQQAKAYTLGIRYGMGDWKLSHTLGIEPEDAQLIIDRYFQAFPGLKKAMDKYLTLAKQRGYVKSKFGRIRHLPEAKQIFTRFGNKLLDPRKGKLIANQTGLEWSEIKEIRKKFNNLLNNALNFPIQSASASIVNRAAIAINREFISRGIDGKVIAQVHDQLIIKVIEKDVEESKELVKDLMENTTKLDKLKLKAPPQVCSNFKEGH